MEYLPVLSSLEEYSRKEYSFRVSFQMANPPLPVLLKAFRDLKPSQYINFQRPWPAKFIQTFASHPNSLSPINTLFPPTNTLHQKKIRTVRQDGNLPWW